MTPARIILVCLTLAAGFAGGLTLTRLSVGAAAPMLATRIGVWTFAPRIGAPEIDPYSRARLFADGELPLAAGEGFSLVARRAGNDAVLDRRCRFRLTGAMPQARYWTLTLMDPRGRLLDNLVGRHAFTSAEIIRAHDGTFSIEIGPEPMAGNWLPTGGAAGPFILMLRLYETPLSATATVLEPRLVPRLEHHGCPE